MNKLIGYNYIMVKGIDKAAELAKTIAQNNYQVVLYENKENGDVWTVSWCSNADYDGNAFCELTEDEQFEIRARREKVGKDDVDNSEGLVGKADVSNGEGLVDNDEDDDDEYEEPNEDGPWYDEDEDDNNDDDNDDDYGKQIEGHYPWDEDWPTWDNDKQ